MKICGIICEYNPMHSGHIYNIQKAKEMTSCNAVVCVMSGNFVQRGEPAVADKYTRAKWAILSGADAVIELPTVFALSPAPNFAYGAVKLLSDIYGLSAIFFGSESGSIEELNKVIEVVDNADIKDHLKQGKSFAQSMGIIGGENFKSNNILAIEYLKSLKILKANHIQPYTIKRQGADFNSQDLANRHCSATAIRALVRQDNLTAAKKFLPDYVFEDLKSAVNTDEALFNMLSHKILTTDLNQLKNFAYVGEGIENRIYDCTKNSNSLSQLKSQISTRRYPESKINRILMCMLLNIYDKDIKTAKKHAPYAKVLALKKGKEDLLSQISKNIDIIIRYNDYKNFANPTLKTDILATDIYSKLTKTSVNDLSKGLQIVE